MTELFELIGACVEFIVSPILVYCLFLLRSNRKGQKEAAKQAVKRDNKLTDIQNILEEQSKAIALQDKELAEMKEINQAQSLVLDQHTQSIDGILNDVNELSSSMEVVKWANKEELSWILEATGELLLKQGYATKEQLHDFEKKFKIYSNGLGGNGVIEKLYHRVLELPNTPVSKPKRTQNKRKNTSKKPEEPSE